MLLVPLRLAIVEHNGNREEDVKPKLEDFEVWASHRSKSRISAMDHVLSHFLPTSWKAHLSLDRGTTISHSDGL